MGFVALAGIVSFLMAVVALNVIPILPRDAGAGRTWGSWLIVGSLLLANQDPQLVHALD